MQLPLEDQLQLELNLCSVYGALEEANAVADLLLPLHETPGAARTAATYGAGIASPIDGRWISSARKSSRVKPSKQFSFPKASKDLQETFIGENEMLVPEVLARLGSFSEEPSAPTGEFPTTCPLFARPEAGFATAEPNPAGSQSGERPEGPQSTMDESGFPLVANPQPWPIELGTNGGVSALPRPWGVTRPGAEPWMLL